jgi:hypothetical protein
MKTTKTLILAIFAAVSLGAGVAMAQDGPSSTSDYWGARNLEAITHQAAPRTAGNNISGFGSYWLHSTPAQADGGTVGGDGSGS